MDNVQKLKLSKPIQIDGKEYNEIPYNLEDFTAKDKMNAGKIYKQDGGVISVQELDADYHLYLFAQAAAKADPAIDITDILRLSAKDSTKAEGIVRNFFFVDLERSQVKSQIESSEKQ